MVPWGNNPAYHAGKFMGFVENRKRQTLRFKVHTFAMKTRKGAIVIERLDERRYAVTVDGIVRFVGTQEGCQQRRCHAERKGGSGGPKQCIGAINPAHALSRASARSDSRGERSRE